MLAALAVIAGCFDPTYHAARCGPGRECPSGFHCEATTCVAGDGEDVPVATPPDPEPDPQSNPRTAMLLFVSCMAGSLTEYNATEAWQIANMYAIQGPCNSCHGDGAGGPWLSARNGYKDMFYAWLQEVHFGEIFTVQLRPDLTYQVVVAEARICNKGTEKANNLGTHPAFDCLQNNAIANLEAFAALVQAKVDRGDPSCRMPPAFDPPGFAPPSP